MQFLVNKHIYLRRSGKTRNVGTNMHMRLMNLRIISDEYLAIPCPTCRYTQYNSINPGRVNVCPTGVYINRKIDGSMKHELKQGILKIS
jgi:hypothetical protein